MAHDTGVHTSGAEKALHALLRLLQFVFAAIVLGVASYLLKLADYYERQLVTPIVFAVLALLFLIPTIMFGFLRRSMKAAVAVAFMDFVIFVGFLTSAGLLRNNFNGPGWQNHLAVQIVTGGNFDRDERVMSLVKLLSGSVVILLILYFLTMLYALYRAYRERKYQREHVHGEKRTNHGNNNGHEQLNRNSLGSTDQTAPGTAQTDNVRLNRGVDDTGYNNTTTTTGVTRAEYV